MVKENRSMVRSVDACLDLKKKERKTIIFIYLILSLCFQVLTWYLKVSVQLIIFLCTWI